MSAHLLVQDVSQVCVYLFLESCNFLRLLAFVLLHRIILVIVIPITRVDLLIGFGTPVIVSTVGWQMSSLLSTAATTVASVVGEICVSHLSHNLDTAIIELSDCF